MSIETWGKNRRSIRGKPSKDQIIRELKEVHPNLLDVYPLTIKDLNTLLSCSKKLESREIVTTINSKKPYISILSSIIDIDWTKASIACLQSMMKEFS